MWKTQQENYLLYAVCLLYKYLISIKQCKYQHERLSLIANLASVCVIVMASKIILVSGFSFSAETEHLFYN